MSGDFSRQTFDPTKHYSSVLMQQGRVQLDADWNEQVAIHQHRTTTEATDVIGACGVPKGNNGFKIEITLDGYDLIIAAGRMYVDGFLCALEATPFPITLVQGSPDQVAVPTLIVDEQALQAGQWIEISADNRPVKILQILTVDPVKGLLTLYDDITDYQGATAPVGRRVMTYTTQLDYPHPEFTNAPAHAVLSLPSTPAKLAMPDGTYVVFIDVWQRDVTALEDPYMREVALGGPDTTTRLKTVWQVRLLPVSTGLTSPPPGSPPSGVVTCDTHFPEWDHRIAPSTGRLNARTKVADATQDPCILPPSAGYSRLENQLYRVEVHAGGRRAQATFKWSRDNASVATSIEEISGGGYVVTVSDLGKDEVLGFAADQWAEVIDEDAELKGMPYPLVRITKIDPTMREITLEQSVAQFDGRLGLRLRRWDQTGNTATTNGVAMTAAWLDLEGNIQVQFSDESYHSGDYWLIPARTATGEIEWPPFQVPNTQPIPQPPVGIRHHYCRLALLEAHHGLLTPLQDCRQLFPSLTTLCAEDICFDNSVCQLPGVDTVQEALDRLCAEHNLRHHNKYLHGYGVVCGLKVRCAPNRRYVIVEKGYALDCEGYDIEVRENRMVDVLQQARARGLLSAQGDGEVCLTIARDGTIAVEPGTSQGFWESVLEGTLLMDFYKECIESLWQFVLRQLWDDPADTKLVPDTQRRLTSLLNLLWQLLNSATGRYVFLASSGAPLASLAPRRLQEHELLHQLYVDVQNRIASETFCAMFDDVRQFPSYPYPVPSAISTLFGPFGQFQQRLKIHPSGQFVYTYGNGTAIHVYNLTTQEMVQALTFPAGDNLDVQDVAFSPDGTAMYAVGVLNNQDSVFATATIGANQTHTWGPTTVVCDIKFVRLATSVTHRGNLYAIGKARGLFIFTNPANIPLTPTANVPFNATGLLRLSDDGGTAFAAEQTGSPVGTEASAFNQVRTIALNTPNAAPVIYSAPGTDQDNDIAISSDTVYITGDPVSGHVKTLRVFPRAGTPTHAPTQLVDLHVNTMTRLAIVPASQFLLITLADPCKVVRLNLRNNILDPNFRIPVQIHPFDITVNSNGSQVYVLNMLSNTLSVIAVAPVLTATTAPPYTHEPPITLSNYLQDILEAFADLLGKFGQYIKDCFCDQFLVDCPECGPNDRVYLGCVEIQREQIYNICNFTKRRYVKSFPTWEYWLSTIPILPLVKQALAKFCCTVF